MQKKLNCSVVGARGYSGLEVVRLLLNHSYADLKFCFATSAFRLEDYISHENVKSVVCLPDSEIFNHLTDVVFLATPAEVSLRLAPKILAAGKTVIDLSGAFRLKKSDYQAWYGFEHTEPQLLDVAQYGLCPWESKVDQLTPRAAGAEQALNGHANLIANPGCYATAIAMALIPLLKNDVIRSDGIVIDAKSGATGAGKKAAESLLFTEVDGECLPYKVGRHQHYPEVVETVERYSGKTIDPHLTTSLLAVRRGIIAGVYAHMEEGKNIEDVQAAFAEAYSEYKLVSFGPMNESAKLVSLKKVVGTGRTHLSYTIDGKKLYVFSCIDNLLKGAASQAIENFNRFLACNPYEGLSRLEVLI